MRLKDAFLNRYNQVRSLIQDRIVYAKKQSNSFSFDCQAGYSSDGASFTVWSFVSSPPEAELVDLKRKGTESLPTFKRSPAKPRRQLLSPG